MGAERVMKRVSEPGSRWGDAWAQATLVAALATLAPGLSCGGRSRTRATNSERARRRSGPTPGRIATDAATDRVVCDPTMDPKDAPCALDDAYGVFVASSAGVDEGTDADEGGLGSGSGDGSMAQPYSTIGEALANLGSKTRIYVCMVSTASR